VTPILLALAAFASAGAQAGPVVPKPNMDPAACAALVRKAPDNAIAAADEWRIKGGGLDARQCLGLAYSAAERWTAAAGTLEAAAHEAEAVKDLRAADFWVEAGNAWLAGGDGARARRAFEAALATPTLTKELRGEAHLDRARASVALGELPAARVDIDKGLELVPGDAFAWYLSAALGRRQGDLPRARDHIAKAVELAPAEAPILLEAANIAGLSGEIDAAAALFARAARAAPDSEAGRAAAAALAANSESRPPAAPQAPRR
jgi:tetratricopeptide (TPR) repeat protein